MALVYILKIPKIVTTKSIVQTQTMDTIVAILKHVTAQIMQPLVLVPVTNGIALQVVLIA